ncbi:sensor histidine kinase [Actinosynnema mirum]|uniref:histidine kinase n=1 Tax=Actinosynnema mirum (strain ATCC 29888 / DSM 43827 / JCM 3225 / NBRC 14064 / NCIMB 13271 / NRRL B-12336 / IMRU 3971 / 101) TaxID=446462 RepID=C6WJX5_ACTMD|nr:histidine kinase [Actinosynnema mirum]ACU36350.1 histidine kinase [Actinosynnema mirum DSM 43827]
MLADVGVAALCVVVFWLPPGEPVVVHVVLVVALGIGVLLRGRAPVVGVVVVSVVTGAGWVVGVGHDPFLAAAWVLHPVAVRYGGSSRRVGVVLGGVLAVLLVTGSEEPGVVLRQVMVSLLALAASWQLGTSVRRERGEAARAARAEGERAVVAERLRVVREVHDVVSHSLGAIALTSGVAVHLGDAEALRRGLVEVERTSKRAMGELRVALGGVRESGPQPGIGDLGVLVRDSPVEADLVVDGEFGAEVPAAVGLAVYRVVQEGLTNVGKHAVGARCSVRVARVGGGVEVSVVDGGGAAVGGGEPGFGLAGVRERVELLGGVFSAGVLAGGGFGVRAVIPGGW